MAEDYKPDLMHFMRGLQNTDVLILTLPLRD